MQKGLIRKGLVFSVIVLFIGVGIQPVFANEVSISTTSDSEDECNCQPIDEINTIKIDKAFIKFEIFQKFLTIFSKNKIEIDEKYDNLLRKIEIIKDREYSPNSNPQLICGSLLFSAFVVVAWMLDFRDSAAAYPEGSILWYIYKFGEKSCDNLLNTIGNIAVSFECEWIENWEPEYIENNIINNIVTG